MVRLGHLREVDVLFTDRPPPEAMAEVLKEADIQVVLPRRGARPEAE